MTRRTRGKRVIEGGSGISSSVLPPTLRTQSEARTRHTMEAPIAFARGRSPVSERRPCLLDVSALGVLRVASAKLHKKASIALTKWLVWDPTPSTWVTKMDVRLRMFAADKAANYGDTRIQHQGRLISWKKYMELQRS